MRLSLIVGSVALIVLAAAPWTASQQPGQTGRIAVSEFVQRRYIHGVTIADARELGPEAAPQLHDLLSRSGNAATYANAVSALGFLGEPSSADVLTRFLTQRFKGEVDLLTFRALLAVPLALGDLARARGGDSPAFRFLADGIRVPAWSSRGVQWQFRSYQGDRLAQLLARLSVNGLARVGNRAARDVLVKTQAETGAEGALLKPNIDDGIVLIERIEKEGVDRVFGASRDLESEAAKATLRRNGIKNQPLIFVAHVLTAITAATIDQRLASGSALLQGVQTTCPDSACAVAMKRQGVVDKFGSVGDTLGVITTAADLNTVFAQRGEVKMVVTLGYCAGASGSYWGCTKSGMKNMILEEGSPADVYTHEFGHAQGLPHNGSCKTNIMHATAANTDAVNATECAAYLK